MSKCDVIHLYLDKHRGEDWYECRTCGAREWFSYRNTIPSNTVLKNCINKSKDN